MRGSELDKKEEGYIYDKTKIGARTEGRDKSTHREGLFDDIIFIFLP